MSIHLHWCRPTPLHWCGETGCLALCSFPAHIIVGFLDSLQRGGVKPHMLREQHKSLPCNYLNLLGTTPVLPFGEMEWMALKNVDMHRYALSSSSFSPSLALYEFGTWLFFANTISLDGPTQGMRGRDSRRGGKIKDILLWSTKYKETAHFLGHLLWLCSKHSDNYGKVNNPRQTGT